MNTKIVTYVITYPEDASYEDVHSMHTVALSLFVPSQLLEDETVGATQRVSAIAEPEVFDRYEYLLIANGATFEVVSELSGTYTLNMLEGLCTQWASDRRILQNGTIAGQSKKLGEEFGELMAGLLTGDKAEITDAIGDMVVVLNNIAVMSGSSLTKCLNGAYNEIKDRKGTMMPDGTFKKEVK